MFEKAFIDNPYPTYHEWLEGGRLFWSPDFFGGAWVLPHYKDNTDFKICYGLDISSPGQFRWEAEEREERGI